MKNFVKNFLLTIGSLLSLFLVLEFLVFRVILVASGLPQLEEQSTPSSLKYLPNQQGYYRLRDEIKSEFHINSDGWNSGLPDYSPSIQQNRKLIVVVGDSYVEAFQVDHRKSFAERLEKKLASYKASVYRFGISGAPLSHYLYMLREILAEYHPRLVVVNMVHNDFKESLVQGSGTYAASLARVVLGPGDETRLTQPKLYERNLTAWIKKSAIFRYIWVRQQVRPQKLKQYWNKLTGQLIPEVEYAANIDVTDVSDLSDISKVIDLIFAEFNKLQQQYNLQFLLVLDGDRRSIVESVDQGVPLDSKLTPLHQLVEQKAEDFELEFLDLTKTFEEDYRKNGIDYDFLFDGHWNSYAHKVVAGELAEQIERMWSD